MTATNADVSGKVNASSGNIGGWSLSENGLTSTEGTIIKNNGITNIYTYGDLSVMQMIILGNLQATSDLVEHYDFNGDGEVTATDLYILRTRLDSLN